MVDPSPALVALARRIVRRDAAGSPGPAASAAAVQAACRRLSDHLVDLLGSRGVDALVRRALHLAQREQPLLAGVTPGLESGLSLHGLEESLAQARTDEEATAAGASVLLHLLGVLLMLIGEDLGMQTIRKVWPRETGTSDIDP